jgi:signal transduction histidine kinase
MHRTFLLAKRIRRRNPLWYDGLLAALLVALTVVPLFLEYSQCCPRRSALALALALLYTVPVAWRRRNPIATFAIVWSAGVAASVALGSPVLPFAMLVVLYSVASHCERRISLPAGGITAVGMLIIQLLTTRYALTPGDYVVDYVVFAAAWVLGDSVRIRRAYTASLEEKAALLQREREDRARRAVAEERERIARELHDVVAHSMSVMVVQAGAARRVMEDQPKRAREALGSIETTGRQALAEMRRLLGVLRKEDDRELALVPQPGLEQLGALVAEFREAGLPVDLVVEGEPNSLPQGVDLSAYRVVQEALTNTLKHAGPARARVLVRYGERDLVVEVNDDGHGAPAEKVAGKGHGLVGMRERVGLFGGELHTGPGHSGGYSVRARFPVEPGR